MSEKRAPKDVDLPTDSCQIRGVESRTSKRYLDITGKPFYVADSGISRVEPDDKDLPDPQQVSICKNFLLNFTYTLKNINPKLRAYDYKFICEKVYEYVSNGAMIQAAAELGFKVRPTRHGHARLNLSKPCLPPEIFDSRRFYADNVSICRRYKNKLMRIK